MVQRNIDKKFKKLPNVFSITDDILIVRYDSDDADHDRILCSMLQICGEENLKLNEDKCNIRFANILFFGENNFQTWCDTSYIQSESKEELQAFMGIIPI